MRKSIAHPLILDVPKHVTKRVKAFEEAFCDASRSCDGIISGQVTEWDPILNDVPFKAASEHEKVLIAILNQLQNANALGRR